MSYAFAIEPAAFQAFENEEEQIAHCKEWGLLSEKAANAKVYKYKGNNLQVDCSIIGFVDPTTVVIEFENKAKHCIHPAYLKEMQAGSFSQRTTVSGGSPQAKSVDSDSGRATATSAITDASADNAETSPKATPSTTGNTASAKTTKSAKPAAKKKLTLPEAKVKMSAIVKEFATVPNHFTEMDDEVVVYEAVTIAEPPLELGDAWSSHSATLKKLELNVGDALTFEAKVIAKKLTRHPVPYKINNPSKIVKETP